MRLAPALMKRQEQGLRFTRIEGELLKMNIRRTTVAGVWTPVVVAEPGSPPQASQRRPPVVAACGRSRAVPKPSAGAMSQSRPLRRNSRDYVTERIVGHAVPDSQVGERSIAPRNLPRMSFRTGRSLRPKPDCSAYGSAPACLNLARMPRNTPVCSPPPVRCATNSTGTGRRSGSLRSCVVGNPP
jgi:hypothetical protein